MAVQRFEIESQNPLGGGISFGEVGPYEQLKGTVHFGVDPDHPRNAAITDLKLAPRDAAGLVNCSADFIILKPADPSRGNHRIFLDVPNRGNHRVLKYFNHAPDPTDPAARLDPGDGFLMRHGYTIVWCGWQHDVPSVNGLLRIRVPDAQDRGNPISGKIMVTLHPNVHTQVESLSDMFHQPYPTNDIDDREATLYVLDHEEAPAQLIPRDQWTFARLEGGHPVPDAHHIHMESGFLPGKVYQVVYSTTGAPVVGLGFLATRDIVSFLKHGTAGEENPCSDDVQYAYGFGASQSGRFLRQLLYLGLNEDEQGRTVFDGLIPHIAGGRRGEFNQRFGQPSCAAKTSIGTLFPHADIEQTDPKLGRSDGLLSKLVAEGKPPKILLPNSSAEYWRGDASLIHTDVLGARDIEPSEDVRIYHWSGTQHPSGTFPLTDTNAISGYRGLQTFNCVEYAPLLRAALVRLDRWVTLNEAPPPSRHPRIDDGTAVPPETTASTFNSIPGVKFPGHLPRTTRLNFGPEAERGIATTLPPSSGEAYPTFVSAVDEDGNELGGIRLPDISAPLATHTGWNLRHPDISAPDQLLGLFIGLIGSTVPFAATRAEREASGDPRLSIEERYNSKEDYLGRFRRAAQTLVDEGYLLSEDLEKLVLQASERYDLFRYPERVPGATDEAGIVIKR